MRRLILLRSVGFIPHDWHSSGACLTRGSRLGFFAQDVPFTTQPRLTFDVLLPLWGHRGPRPAPSWARAEQTSRRTLAPEGLREMVHQARVHNHVIGRRLDPGARETPASPARTGRRR